MKRFTMKTLNLYNKFPTNKAKLYIKRFSIYYAHIRSLSQEKIHDRKFQTIFAYTSEKLVASRDNNESRAKYFARRNINL